MNTSAETVVNVEKNVLEKLSCPYHTESGLNFNGAYFECYECKRRFPVFSGIPYILPDHLLNKYANGKFVGQHNEWMPGERVWRPGHVTGLLSRFSNKKLETAIYSLDIGCGEHSQGEVNIDIYVPKVVPNNFIVASAEHLPFKDKVFDTVKSSYVIEHCIQPAEFIVNQVRIARKEVVVITDNSEWIGDVYFRIANTGRIFHDEHYYLWTVEYLANLIRILGYKADVRCENLSPTTVVRVVAILGKIPRIGNLFYRDLVGKIIL